MFRDGTSRRNIVRNLCGQPVSVKTQRTIELSLCHPPDKCRAHMSLCLECQHRSSWAAAVLQRRSAGFCESEAGHARLAEAPVADRSSEGESEVFFAKSFNESTFSGLNSPEGSALTSSVATCGASLFVPQTQCRRTSRLLTIRGEARSLEKPSPELPGLT